MHKYEHQKHELITAIFVLFITLIALLYVNNFLNYSLSDLKLDNIKNYEAIRIIIILIVHFINIAIVYRFVTSFIFKNRRGLKLKEISKTNKPSILFPILIFGLTLTATFLLLVTKFEELGNYESSHYSFLIAYILISKSSLKKKVRLPEVPNLKNKVLIGSYGELENEYSEFGKKSGYVTIGPSGLVGNTLILGTIRSSKSVALVVPMISDLFTNFDAKMPSLIMDHKHSFVGYVRDILKKSNKIHLLDEINLSSNVYFNLIYRSDLLKKSNLDDVTNLIKLSISGMIGDAGDAKIWLELSASLIRSSLALAYSKYGYYTFLEVKEVMAKADDEDFLKEMEGHLNSSRFDEEEKQNLKMAWIAQKEFSKLAEKQRSSIRLSAKVFFDIFNTYEVAKVFCPREDQITYKTMNEAIDANRIMIFNVENEFVARPIGTMFKLAFQQSVLDLAKVSPRSKRFSREKRFYNLIIDEAHFFLVSSQGALSDEKYCSVAGERNAINIYATQDYSGIKTALGGELPAKNFINHLRTRFITHTLDEDTVSILKDMGKQDRKSSSISYSESSNNPTRLIGGEYTSNKSGLTESITFRDDREDVFTREKGRRLRTFEAYGVIYDGFNTKLSKLYLRPYFLPRSYSYKQIVEAFGKFKGEQYEI